MRTLLVLALLSRSVTCLSAPTPMEQPLPEGQVSMVECEYTNDEPAIVSLFAESIEKGTYHYNVYVPQGCHARADLRYPCLFIESPGGNAGMDNVGDYARTNGWLIVMLDESRNGPSDPCIGNFLAAHDDAVKRFRLAEGRKVLTGFSGGAREASMHVGMRPGFAGVILQGAGFNHYREGQKKWGYKLAAVESDKALRVCGIFGDKDSNRVEIGWLERRLPGHTARRFALFPGGHDWAPAESMKKALDWIDSRGDTDAKPAAAGAQAQPIVIPLSPRDGRKSGAYSQTLYCNFDKDGAGTVPFPTAAREIKFRVAGQDVWFDLNGDGRFDSADGGPYHENESLAIGLSIEAIMHKQWGQSFLRLPCAVVLSGRSGNIACDLFERSGSGVFDEMGHLGVRFHTVDENRSRTTDLVFNTFADKGIVPLMGLMEVDNEIKQVSFDSNRLAVVLSPYTGAVGRVRVETTDTNFEARGSLRLRSPGARFEALFMPGRETPVLPGTYDALVMINPRRIGQNQKLPALYGDSAPPITLCATTNVVKLGPPFELKFRASRASNDTGKITVNEAVLAGVSGERYRGQQYFPTEGGWGSATSLTRCLIRRGEEQQHLLKLEYG